MPTALVSLTLIVTVFCSVLVGILAGYAAATAVLFAFRPRASAQEEPATAAVLLANTGQQA